MHLFGKSAPWWLCFLLYNNLRRRIKSELENTELCPSQKLKLFSECVKYPDIWSRSKTKAKQGGRIGKGKRHGQCWNSFWQDAFIFWEIEILLIRLTRLQGACQALKSSPAVWWIRLLLPATHPDISAQFPPGVSSTPYVIVTFLHFFCNFLSLWPFLPSNFRQIRKKWQTTRITPFQDQSQIKILGTKYFFRFI